MPERRRKILILTVGVGGTIKSGIMRSIEDQNPDKVVLLFTRQSKEKHGAELISEISQRGIEIEERVSSTESEADQLLSEYLRIIKIETKNGKVSVDITFGTKAMTSALYSAGLVSGLEVASYVEGRRDSDGKVIPGSERVLVIPYELSRIAMSCKRLVELYNSYHYGSALQIAEQINRATSDADNLRKRKTQTLYFVCELAYLWDKFEFKGASEKALELLEYAEEVAHLFGGESDPLLIQENIKAVAEYLTTLTNDEKEKRMNPNLVWELIRNAERRDSNSLWDDAVGRLYRATEYIAQIRLYEKDLFDPKEGRPLPPKDRSILPLDLREALGRKRPFGLKDLYRYLARLGDPIGDRLIEKDELRREIGDIISRRNKSILAHGFRVVDKDAYETMRELVLELVRAVGIEEPRFNILKLNEDLIL